MPERHTVTATIVNRLGLHARPAMEFVDTAARFSSEISVRRADGKGDDVDAKSIMQMMLLAATQGTDLEISAHGDDADDACRVLKALVDSGFGE
ncbi:MAG: HPr family phosphocarrier protein [Planctomycetota bacterium]